jgi:hypothetical protein
VWLVTVSPVVEERHLKIIKKAAKSPSHFLYNIPFPEDYPSDLNFEFVPFNIPFIPVLEEI